MTFISFSRFSFLIFLSTTHIAQSTDYIGVNMMKSFHDAESYCNTRFNSHLASIHNTQDETSAAKVCAKLYSLGSQATQYTPCWIGLDGSSTKYGDSVGTYIWVDGSGTPGDDYTPTVSEINGGEYAFILSDTGELEDTADTHTFPFICNAPRYVGIVLPKTFSDAENYCVTNFGTHLASVHSVEEQAELWERCNSNYFNISLAAASTFSWSDNFTYCWFGLDANGERADITLFAYTDGSSMDYSPGTGVNVEGNVCEVVHSHTGYWYDWFCETKLLSFVCGRADNHSYPMFIGNNSEVLPINSPTNQPSSSPSKQPSRLPSRAPVTTTTVITPAPNDASSTDLTLDLTLIDFIIIGSVIIVFCVCFNVTAIFLYKNCVVKDRDDDDDMTEDVFQHMSHDDPEPKMNHVDSEHKDDKPGEVAGRDNRAETLLPDLPAEKTESMMGKVGVLAGASASEITMVVGSDNTTSQLNLGGGGEGNNMGEVDDHHVLNQSMQLVFGEDERSEEADHAVFDENEDEEEGAEDEDLYLNIHGNGTAGKIEPPVAGQTKRPPPRREKATSQDDEDDDEEAQTTVGFAIEENKNDNAVKEAETDADDDDPDPNPGSDGDDDEEDDEEDEEGGDDNG